ncbi:MAG: zinc ribbon domain-containing protein [Chloroflexi bacterium]|nr:zinc ribbon domain-containing protein [Chloroflexota bacterium]MCY3937791.1 zinc ribbon domain-containing protein [Chloroflexota bacterium]
MPTYDYQCRNCGKRTSRLFRSFAAVHDFPCPGCGELELERKISKVAVIRGSARSGGDGIDSGLESGLEQEDPRAIARMARSMAQEMGEEMPPGYDELLGRMEAGETPDEEEFMALDDAESNNSQDPV